MTNFSPLLVTETKEEYLFSSSDPADDIAEVCRGFSIDFKLTTTILCKAASTAAYDELNDNERRKLAAHITHRSETQFRAYSAKNRRAEAAKTVEKNEAVTAQRYAASTHRISPPSGVRRHRTRAKSRAPDIPPDIPVEERQ